VPERVRACQDGAQVEAAAWAQHSQAPFRRCRAMACSDTPGQKAGHTLSWCMMTRQQADAHNVQTST
jgi:hypothetical protein